MNRFIDEPSKRGLGESILFHPCRTIGCVVKTVVVVRGVVRDVGAVVVHVDGRTVDVLCKVKNSSYLVTLTLTMFVYCTCFSRQTSKAIMVN